MWRAEEFLEEFPIVLSTTFSARSSLHNAEYDYVIMDEASQVSAETGFLALSCARNAVIVGDTMQLPNIVSQRDLVKYEAVFEKHIIAQGYDCGRYSFLQSIVRIIPDVPQTLLREHYRCDPRIINFCNQKFYDGTLLIMSSKKREKPLMAVKTVVGNHSRDHQNQREVDVICQEVLPEINYDQQEIGIIAPYNSQVNSIKYAVGNDIEVATVHKFQGREKKAIIMSVVDDQISEFVDDPNLLNVAVSRAKEFFCLVVSGNNMRKQGNITDLLGYIEYNEGIIQDSKLCSIYDMLYKQYDEARERYLKKHGRISEYDSENLTYTLLKDILRKNESLSKMGVLCHYPLKMLIRDTSLLSNQEFEYISHVTTHVDFLIFNKVSKTPVLSVEVDGWAYHKDGSVQLRRDLMKDAILLKYNINFLRLPTTGSGERKKIEDAIKDYVC